MAFSIMCSTSSALLKLPCTPAISSFGEIFFISSTNPSTRELFSILLKYPVMTRIFPTPLVIIPNNPAAVCPLNLLSIPTKQHLFVPTISELNVTTGIFFSFTSQFNFSLTPSVSTGISASPWIPSFTSSSIARSWSSSRTEAFSFTMTSTPSSSSSFFPVWIPLFISSMKEEPESWVTIPIFFFPPAFFCLFLALCTYPISSAVLFTISATSGLIRPRLLSARSTVPLDTPAFSAICCIVTDIYALLITTDSLCKSLISYLAYYTIIISRTQKARNIPLRAFLIS